MLARAAMSSQSRGTSDWNALGVAVRLVVVGQSLALRHAIIEPVAGGDVVLAQRRELLAVTHWTRAGARCLPPTSALIAHASPPALGSAGASTACTEPV